MNKPFFISAAVVITAGAVIFAKQTGRLAEARQIASAEPSTVSAPAAASSRTWAPPPAKRPEPEGRLLDRLGERLVASLDLPQMTLFLEATDSVELGRIVSTAHLTEEEQKAFEEKFAAFRREQALLMKRKDLNGAAENEAWKNLAEQKKDWIAAQLGPGRMAKVEEAKEVTARAGAERDAAQLVSRISNAADLTTDQKDRLYATFVEQVQRAPAIAVPEDQALKFRVSGSMKEEPPVPDISEEARAILTPEQLSLHEQSSTLSLRQQETMMDAIKSMAPSAIVTLQEFLDEAPSSRASPPQGESR
jgi:hypothetical protein